MENEKKCKQGRIPKGFFSSNTAYTLVYKRTKNHLETSKATVTKKFNHSPYDHVVGLQNPPVTFSRDRVNPLDIAIKGKRLCKYNELETDGRILEKKTKIELDTNKARNCFPTKKDSQNRSHKTKNFDCKDDVINELDYIKTKKEQKRENSAIDISCGQRNALKHVSFIDSFSL